jgi:hypothetical protein
VRPPQAAPLPARLSQSLTDWQSVVLLPLCSRTTRPAAAAANSHAAGISACRASTHKHTVGSSQAWSCKPAAMHFVCGTCTFQGAGADRITPCPQVVDTCGRHCINLYTQGCIASWALCCADMIVRYKQLASCADKTNSPCHDSSKLPVCSTHATRATCTPRPPE